jgi:hypothetical protein
MIIVVRAVHEVYKIAHKGDIMSVRLLLCSKFEDI